MILDVFAKIRFSEQILISLREKRFASNGESLAIAKSIWNFEMISKVSISILDFEFKVKQYKVIST
jgi:hypothetical protein